MQLQPGTRLGPYEIVSPIGAGGMGEVYRARDTRLDRSVAIKVLPSEFAADARLRSRFEREAKTISGLNHPHICTLHDVGRENGLDYIVMEYCEGQTLAQRLEHGALSVEHVLQYGIEIADALSRAHRAGIIHRDLKPSNIMLTKSGVKLLDFGLAKQQATGSDAQDTTSLQGTIVGTVQYMAPEVLNGREADARSDIFALGLVLYEMVSGKPAFSGTSKASVMASILEHEPPPANTSPALKHVIDMCLAKDPDARWESAHDIAEELRWVRENKIVPMPSRNRAWMVILAIGIVAAIVVVTWRVSDKRPQPSVVRLTVPLPQGSRLADLWSEATVAISPDGKTIAYCIFRPAVSQLFVQQLDSFEPVLVAGVENAFAPFFSPDGQWIGFLTRDGHLRKVRVTGGASQTICSFSRQSARGATWGADGTIYFAPSFDTGLWRVSANGGTPIELTRPNAASGENSHRWPHTLPDGKHLLFTIRTDQLVSFDDAKIAVLSLSDGTWRVVLEGGMSARYLPTGHLLFARGGALYTVPFDLRSLSVQGTPRRVLDDVLTDPGSGGAHYDVTERGDVAYATGGPVLGETQIIAVDRAGRSNMLTTLPFHAWNPQVSADGKKIAFSRLAANDQIWLHDVESGSTSRLSFEPGDEGYPVWTRDGNRVIYGANRPDRFLARRVDGAGEAEELWPIRGSATSCSTEFLAFDNADPTKGWDIWLLPLNGDRKPRPFLRTQFNEAGAQFSPDGKWVAYQSNMSGSFEIYVQPTQGDSRWQVSSGGGRLPRWSRDGKEIFYRVGDNMFAVSFGRRVGKPRLLFSIGGAPYYDVTKDGFLMMRLANLQRPQPQLNVILNWTRELVSR